MPKPDLPFLPDAYPVPLYEVDGLVLPRGIHDGIIAAVYETLPAELPETGEVPTAYAVAANVNAHQPAARFLLENQLTVQELNEVGVPEVCIAIMRLEHKRFVTSQPHPGIPYKDVYLRRGSLKQDLL